MAESGRRGDQGHLDPTTALLLERHVQNCPDCVAFLRTYRESIRLTRTLRYEDIPGDLQDRVHAILRHNEIQGLKRSLPPYL